MQEKGTVVALDNDTMTVCFKRSSMCEKCGACHHAQEQMQMQVQRQAEAQVGDQVAVHLKEGTVLRAAAIAYGIPLAALLAGLWLGTKLPGWLGWAAQGEWFAAVLGFGLATIAFLLIRATEGKRSQRGIYIPQVISVERAPTSGHNPQTKEEQTHGE